MSGPLQLLASSLLVFQLTFTYFLCFLYTLYLEKNINPQTNWLYKNGFRKAWIDFRNSTSVNDGIKFLLVKIKQRCFVIFFYFLFLLLNLTIDR